MVDKNNPPTPEEIKLANALRERGVKFTTDKRFPYPKLGGTGFFKPDIVIPRLKLVIEVDGTHHTGTAKQVRADKLRAKTAREEGYETDHVSNYLVNNPEQLREYADQIAGEYLQSPDMGVVKREIPRSLTREESLAPPWINPSPKPVKRKKPSLKHAPSSLAEKSPRTLGPQLLKTQKPSRAKQEPLLKPKPPRISKPAVPVMNPAPQTPKSIHSPLPIKDSPPQFPLRGLSEKWALILAAVLFVSIIILGSFFIFEIYKYSTRAAVVQSDAERLVGEAYDKMTPGMTAFQVINLTHYLDMEIKDQLSETSEKDIVWHLVPQGARQGARIHAQFDGRIYAPEMREGLGLVYYTTNAKLLKVTLYDDNGNLVRQKG